MVQSVRQQFVLTETLASSNARFSMVAMTMTWLMPLCKEDTGGRSRRRCDVLPEYRLMSGHVTTLMVWDRRAKFPRPVTLLLLLAHLAP